MRIIEKTPIYENEFSNLADGDFFSFLVRDDGIPIYYFKTGNSIVNLETAEMTSLDEISDNEPVLIYLAEITLTLKERKD